jgi:hypothetical protein
MTGSQVAALENAKDGLRRAIRPFVPVAIRNRRQRNKEQAMREKFERLRPSVARVIQAVRDLPLVQCSDVSFLEREFIPSLGLNDELLHEQPAEFSNYFGSGLHIWQYPNQLAGYLAWLSGNSKEITCYAEIGCRWGGTFILVSEWLQRHGRNMRKLIGIDLVEMTPLVDEYFQFLHHERESGRRNVESLYVRDYSTGPEVKDIFRRNTPDFVFIDGDHSLRGAMADHMLARDYARIIVHHDVHSQSCPEISFLWESLKRLEGDSFDFFEFVDQYSSVNGHFLGIGAMRRKESFYKRELDTHSVPSAVNVGS